MRGKMNNLEQIIERSVRDEYRRANDVGAYGPWQNEMRRACRRAVREALELAAEECFQGVGYGARAIRIFAATLEDK